MRSLRKRMLAVGLCAVLTVNTTVQGFTGGLGMQKIGGGNSPTEPIFFDALDAIGNTTATIGCILNIGSTLANANWDDPGGVCLSLVDTIFGTSFGGDPVQDSLDAIYSDVEEIKNTTNKISDGVDYLKANSIYVNQQLSVINGSLKTVNSQLARQSQQLSEISNSLKEMKNEMNTSFDNLTNLINADTEELKSVVYQSTFELKKTDKINDALTFYNTNYANLFTYDNNILETLSAMQDSYTAFYDEVNKLDNSTEVIEALNKVTLESDNYDKLNETDKEILTNTYVKVGGKKQQVYKFHTDFVKTLMEFVAGTGSDKSQSVYTLNGNVGNIGDAVISMGDYLTGSNQVFGITNDDMGIGEMYYLYCTLEEKDNETVHKKYKSFMDCMVAQYMTTAWLAEMAYGYRMANEANGDNNATTIRNYEQYLNRIHAQMFKVYAYYDYEYKKCINTYDYGGNYLGHDQEIVYYGNLANDRVWSVKKKNEIKVPSGISDDSLILALGEEYDLHYYYRYADVTRRDGIVWSSSNPQVAVVDKYGEVLGLSRGVATITAEYMGTTASCTISIGDVMAIPNDDGVSRYHYHEYYSKGGNWVTDETLSFDVDSEKGYDYYYGINTYIADTVELSDEKRSASIIESTGLTDENMSQFEWFVTGDGAVTINGYEISAVSGGWTEVIGYKKNDNNHTYEFIGIPVHSTQDTLFNNNYTDYSDYIEIGSAQDLIDLSNNEEGWGSDSKYVLTSDIDLGGMEWNPIGYAVGFGETDLFENFTINSASRDRNGKDSYYAYGINKPFMGTFDGNGHTISNFKITKIPRIDEIEAELSEKFAANTNNVLESDDRNCSLVDVGLFGYAANATIVNVNITDAKIELDTSNSSGVKFDGEEMPYRDEFLLYGGNLVGAYYNSTLVGGLAEMENKLISYFGMDEQGNILYTEERINELYDKFKAPARFKEYYQELKDNAQPDDKETPQEKFGNLLLFYSIWSSINDFAPSELNGCYATGEININNTCSTGGVFVGMIVGGTNYDINDCTALGEINVNSSRGGVGGLLGVWYVNSGVSISENTSDVKITALGGVNAGGIVGKAEGDLCMNSDMIELTEEDTFEQTQNKLQALVLLSVAFAYLERGNMIEIDVDDPNAKLNNNEVLGDIVCEGNAGGLLGEKTSVGSDVDFMQIMYMKLSDINNPDAITAKHIFYNIDMETNYVACDITSTNGKAAGLIGLSNVYDDRDQELKEGEVAPTVFPAQICKNYYTGKINAGSTGYAAGLVALVECDYAELKQNISAATEITGGGENKVAYIINGREKGMPLVSGEGNAWNVEGALHYSELPGWAGNDYSTAGDASKFNNPDTYIDIFGDDNFLDLSGGLKEDGTAGLDLRAGLIPTRLDNRFRFQTETVPTSYHQGEDFVPVTGIYKYTGTGVELITEGVETTTPDMTEIGVQTVTLTYGDFTDSYEVRIYPAAGYLNVTEKTTVAKDGSKLSGGKITLYENGKASGKYNIDDVDVTAKDGGIYVIKKGKYTTALRAIIVDVYTNEMNGATASYVGREYYGQGEETDLSKLVPSKKTVDGKTYKLMGTSQDIKFKAVNDVCVLSYYGYGSASSGDDEDDANVIKGPKVGTKISDKKYYYEVTKAGTSKVNGEVKVVGLKKKSLKTIKIAAQVKINGVTYKVIAVDKNAFKGNKKITKAMIGLNVKSIGANAFANCKKLRQVTINSKVLKSIGKKAFFGNKKLTKVIIKSKKLKKVAKKAFARKGGKKVTFRVPKKKKKAYKKLLKKAKTNKFVVK